MKATSKPRRVLYIETAGDIETAWQHWSKGVLLGSETSVPFSQQVFDSVRAVDGQLTAVSFRHASAGEKRSGYWVHSGEVRNIPRPFNAVGIGYYFAEKLNALWIVVQALRVRANTVLVNSGTCLLLPLVLLRLWGVQVVYVGHNTLWPAGFPPRSILKRLVLWMDACFYRWGAQAVFGVSSVCAEQVRSIAKVPPDRLKVFTPLFPPGCEHWLDAKHVPVPPFKLLFAGRVEQDKGIFDLIDMAVRLQQRHSGLFTWTVCGEGTDLDAARARVQSLGLQGQVRFLGRLQRPALLEQYRLCDAVLVPTRSSFSEGFAMVVAESVMTGRPVVTSPVVPAAYAASEGVAWATTDDTDSYCSAIEALFLTPDEYSRKVQGCCAAAGQFISGDRSLKNTLIQWFEQNPVGHENN